MTLGNILKYIVFLFVTLFTINTIATYNVSYNYKPRLFLAIEPYDTIIATDIQSLITIRDESKNILSFASALNKIYKDIKVLNIQNDFITIKRNYIYNEDIKFNLIECDITIYIDIVNIERCTYNEKIFNKLKEITKPLNDQQNEMINKQLSPDKLSKKLITSIYENLLSYQYYDLYFKKYFNTKDILTPSKNKDRALKLLDYNLIIEGIDDLYVKEEKKDENYFTISKIYEYDFREFLCESKIENKLLSLNSNLRTQAPENTPPISVITSCKNKTTNE